MKKLKLELRRASKLALAIGVIAMAASPVLAAPKKNVGPAIAAGQSRYLVEYNPGNKQAVAALVAAQGGRIVYDYSALLNGFAVDLSDNGVKTLRTSGLAKTIEGDVIRTMHAQPRFTDDSAEDLMRRASSDRLAIRKGVSPQRADSPTAAAAPTRTLKSSGLTAKSLPSSPVQSIRATSSVQAGQNSESSTQGAAFQDGGIDMAPNAVPSGFPGFPFAEFVGWDRDRANADVVWSVGPNFGTADNGIATPDVAAGAVTGAGVVVGVLDTGIQYGHPDLAANIIDDRGDPTIRNFLEILPGAADLTFNGHGTSVASVIASVDNDIGLIGVAPGAKIRPYRVCDGGCPLSAIIGGLVQATIDGVDVINMSFGGGAGKNFEASAIQAAAAAGIVLVASAGNDGDQKIQFPAGYGQVLAVGATDINDNAASFTNFGGWVDLTGPGVSNPTATCFGCGADARVTEDSPTPRGFTVLGMTGSANTTVADAEVVFVGRGCTVTGGDTHLTSPAGKVALIERGFCSFAEKVLQAEAAGAIGTIVHNDFRAVLFGGTLGGPTSVGPSVTMSQADGLALRADIAAGPTVVDVAVASADYWFISGTSFSGPTVAGVAALVRSANPGLSADEVRQLIISTAESFGNQNLFGAGMVRADNAVNAAQP